MGQDKPRIGRTKKPIVERFGAGIHVLITHLPEGVRLRKGKGGYYLKFRARGATTIRRGPKG